MAVELTLHAGQEELLYDQRRTFHAITAGVGYGKTKFGPWWHFYRVVNNPKSTESGVVAPTQRLLRTRCLVDYLAHLRRLGLKEGKKRHFHVNRSSTEMSITFHLWKGHEHRVLFLSGESPESIVAYNFSHVWIDEAALCDPDIMSRCIHRLRCPTHSLRRQILCTSTPEGTNWFYGRFGPHNCRRIEGTDFSIGKSALVLHGSSFDNPYLDDDYRQLLRDEFGWDEAYFQNYVLGLWTSLAKNRFYFSFNEGRNVGDFPPMLDIKRLILTFDNNVGKLAWCGLQPYKDTWICVAANRANARTLDEAVQQILDTFPPAQWAEHGVEIYGDATLHHRSLQSYETGYDILHAAIKAKYPRAILKAHRANPAVEDRLFVTNRLFERARLIIDRRCVKVIESARIAETDGKRGIKKKANDDVTHPMEAIDMALVNLEPRVIERPRARGVNLG